MSFRRLVFWTLFALAGYAGYGYSVAHFNRASQAYQNFAASVVRDDREKASLYAWDNAPLSAFNYSAQRSRELGQGQIKLEYYTINSLNYSEDGDSATIEAIHTVRVDPPGDTSVFGKMAVDFPEHVQLEKRDGLWKVKQFADYYTMSTPQ